MKHLTLVILLFSWAARTVAAPSVTLEVSAGSIARPAGTICSVEVKDLFPPGTAEVRLTPGASPGQLSGDRLHFLLPETIDAGEKKRFRAESAGTNGTMSCLENPESIELKDSGRLVLRFVKQPTPEAARHDPVYTRTGYIHPLLTPGGRAVTGDYPADHVHQHALFFAWTKTGFEGRAPEFWNQKLRAGRVDYERTVRTESGALFAGFTVANLCEDLTAPGGPRPALRETWTVRAWKSDGNANLVDIELEQTCATGSPLTIRKYHYGGMAIRGNAAWLGPDKNTPPPGDFLTSEGKGRKKGNHSRPEWVAMHGPLESAHASVTVFPHPSNFRHPQHVRLHPSKPYFVFAPMVEEPFRITPETPYRIRFRYLVEDAKPDPERLEAVRAHFADPPKVDILTD